MSGLGRCPLALPFACTTGVRTTWPEVINTATRARTLLRLRCSPSFSAKGRGPEPQATNEGYYTTDRSRKTINNQLVPKGYSSLRVAKFPLIYTFHSLYTSAEMTHNPERSL